MLFFRYKAFFTILEHLKLKFSGHIYSLQTGQILKQLSPSVSVTTVTCRYLSSHGIYIASHLQSSGLIVKYVFVAREEGWAKYFLTNNREWAIK